MALRDYRLCDACEEKVFYDAELDYRFPTREDPIEPDERAKVCGLGGSYRLQYLGDWAVLCEQCAKTHRTAILPVVAEQTISADEETVRAAIEAAQLVPNKDTDAYEALARLVTVAYGRADLGVQVVPSDPDCTCGSDSPRAFNHAANCPHSTPWNDRVKERTAGVAPSHEAQPLVWQFTIGQSTEKGWCECSEEKARAFLKHGAPFAVRCLREVPITSGVALPPEGRKE